MSAAPPAIFVGIGMDERIVGAVFPRSVDALRTSHDNHVTGGRTCRATLGIEVIVVVANLAELGTFEAKTFGGPIFRIHPSGIDHLLGARNDVQAVVGELGTLARTHEQPALTILSHYMAGVDVGNAQIDGLAPRAIGRIG